MVAISDPILFANLKAPLYPRLAHGKAWDEQHVWYEYRMGHILPNGSTVWSKMYSFKASPYPGQDSLQRVIIFGDMGKAERDGTNQYANYQPGSLITTDQLINDLDNYDIVFHIGDLPYANGYLSQWDQFTAQVQAISSAKPYMIASGNHERDFPNSGSFYDTPDSGGECGVPAETMYYVPADNRAKFWQKQPWLIFASHRVLGYSSNAWLANEGAFEEPMGRANLQKLWQKYKVDIALHGHVHKISDMLLPSLSFVMLVPHRFSFCLLDRTTQVNTTKVLPRRFVPRRIVPWRFVPGRICTTKVLDSCLLYHKGYDFFLLTPINMGFQIKT
ncbi:purple acid phosphatase 27 [Artemisia annua]|uniref:Purple acid phosphatase 27 n=1 Tax=Artemisia annua TaxID=35608 RepID=A0A2U1NI89_ARTAN|nr:purple acid phosphatase 27 [Artemisia annua]